MAPVYIALLVAGPDWRLVALILFVVVASTDWLDGYLARRLHQTSRAGELLDPVADKLLLISSVILLAIPRFAGEVVIPVAVVLSIAIKDLAAVAGTLWLLSLSPRARFPAKVLGKIATALQMLLVVLTMLAPMIGSQDMIGVLQFLWWAVGITSLLATIGYIRIAARQLRLQRNMLRSGGKLRVAAIGH